MREIKFRAWDKQKKEMHVGVWVNQHSVCIDGSHFLSDEIMLPMQFTGLRDKNGKEIYEGDILYFEEPRYESDMVRCEVKFIDGCFVASEITPSIHGGHQNYALMEIGEAEIIGNIHENSDLLQPPTIKE